MDPGVEGRLHEACRVTVVWPHELPLGAQQVKPLDGTGSGCGCSSRESGICPWLCGSKRVGACRNIFIIQ